MGDNHQHLTEDELFQNLSSPERSASTSLDVSRQASPVPHLKDGNGNDPSDRLKDLDDDQQMELTASGAVVDGDRGEKESELPRSKQRQKVAGGDGDGNSQSLEETMEEEELAEGREEVEHDTEPTEEVVASDGGGEKSAPASAMRGASHRPHARNVHWRSHTKPPTDYREPDNVSKEAKRAARRLVRNHTGRPPVPAPTSDDEDASASGSAVSLTSTNSRQPSSSRQHRRSSGDYSTQSSGDEDASVPRRRGVLSELLSLYQRDRRDTDRSVVKSLMSSSDEMRRRRWSEKSLFDESTGSRRSSASSMASGVSGVSSDGESGGEDLRERDTRVRHNRRKQHLPHRSQDLNEPYIPSPKHSHPISPSINVNPLQRAYTFLTRHGGPATWLGSPSPTSNPRRGGEGDYRNIVALIITTSSLAGPASPALSRLAPAAGAGAETSSGERKLSYYENAREKTDRLRLDEERDNESFGDGEGNLSDLGKVMEEGRAYKHRLRNGRKRGKRRQREMAVTKHIASIIERKRFIEMLAKSVVNFGAPAHAIESWLTSTADILQVDASFIYLPNVLIVAFRDSDVHSTDILFIRSQGGLELYRLSLLHQVYRKVVRDEISASQGCRVLRRIERQTIPYPVAVLVLTAAIASATASRVAFSGSFVDILMSGVLGSILATVQFAIAGKHRLLSNIFEIGMAGILSFLARALGSTGYFCYQSLVSAGIVLILPGWHICLGALELGSKNILAGGIRVVWAIVYTLFLSFGLSIGSQVWDAFGPEQPGLDETPNDGVTTVTVQGSFYGNDTVWNEGLSNGTFTFSNGSSTSTMTQVACYRNPDLDHWWYNEVNDWWLFLLVPVFAAALGVWFRADYRSRDMFVMVIVGSAGYVVSFFLDTQLDQPNVTSAVAAFTVGVLGNLYSRIGGGSAFPSMVVGILLQVPNAIAAAGGLSADSDTDNPQGINTAVLVSIRMIQVGIGLAIGLFAAALVIYPFGKGGRYIFSY